MDLDKVKQEELYEAVYNLACDKQDSTTLTNEKLCAILQMPSSSSSSTSLNPNVNQGVSKGAKFIEVRCGPLKGRMHVELFVCPGIHQNCIQLEGKNYLITPKALTIRAETEKQKDWKGSIKIGRTSLRTLMETRSFDFYNHANFCSAKCQSRNYIIPRNRYSYDANGRPIIWPSDGLRIARPSDFTPIQMEQKVNTLGDLFKNPAFSNMLQRSQAMSNNNNSSIVKLLNGTTQVKEEVVDVKEEVKMDISQPLKTVKSEEDNIDQLNIQMQTDPTVFWHEMAKTGVSNNIIDQMIYALNGMREKLNNGNVNNVAPFLSRTIAALGICDKVASTVRRRSSSMVISDRRRSTASPSVENSFISTDDSNKKIHEQRDLSSCVFKKINN